jgi:hypothetical protein
MKNAFSNTSGDNSMRFVSCFLNNRLTIAPEKLVKDPDLKLVPFSELPEVEPQPLNSAYKFDEKLQQILFGKMLLLDEIPFSLIEIHEHYENGYLNYNAGIMAGNVIDAEIKKIDCLLRFPVFDVKTKNVFIAGTVS